MGELRQEDIDRVRMDLILQRMITFVRKDNLRPPVAHVWFPKAKLASYALRDGNPPSDSDRPKHLRGKRLEVDVGEIAPSTARAIKELLHKRRVEQDVTKPVADYEEARKMLEQMREPRRLIWTP